MKNFSFIFAYVLCCSCDGCVCPSIMDIHDSCKGKVFRNIPFILLCLFFSMKDVFLHIWMWSPSNWFLSRLFNNWRQKKFLCHFQNINFYLWKHLRECKLRFSRVQWLNSRKRRLGRFGLWTIGLLKFSGKIFLGLRLYHKS